MPHPINPGLRLLSVRQVAEVFGVSVATIWRWTAGGAIPTPIKIGGSTRWRRDEIEAVLSATEAA